MNEKIEFIDDEVDTLVKAYPSFKIYRNSLECIIVTNYMSEWLHLPNVKELLNIIDKNWVIAEYYENYYFSLTLKNYEHVLRNRNLKTLLND